MSPDEIARMRALWGSYLDKLRDAGDALFRDATPSDETTAAEGLRHLSRLARLGLIASFEYADPEVPVLVQLVDEVTKFGCDNPDTIYQRAVLNGAHPHRIVGRRGTVDYLSFITARAGADGRQEQIGQIDTKTLSVGADGSFVIALSPDPVPGNWLRLTPETRTVSVRQTFKDRGVERAADLRIERVGAAPVPAPLTIAAAEAGLTAAAGFTRYCATLFPDWTESYLAHVNALPPADQDACLRAGGDPNIYFYRSVWRLGPDEALIVHIPHIPACDTWNLQVDNWWQESMDYRHHRSSLNPHSAVRDADGGVTAVIAHADAGHPNWLDTAGHVTGHFAMRWIRAAEHVDPTTRLCSLDEVRALAGEGRG